MNRTAAAAGALAISAATVLAGTMFQSNSTIHACVSKKTGVVRVVEDCRAGERDLTWNRRGPRGLTGERGLPGLPGSTGARGDNGFTTTIERQTRMGFAPAGNGSNWADGPGAFAAATTTTQSTGFGVNAFQQVTSGANNTGLGYGAGRTVVTGYGNTALGTAAMYEAGPAAFFNVALGLHAGRYLTGSGNVVIGTDAAGGAGSIDETVIIGHNAYAGGGGRVAIGSGASANHSNSVAIGQNTGTTGPAQVSVGPRDVEVTDPAKGVVLVSPNGTRFRITVANDGSLTTVPVG